MGRVRGRCWRVCYVDESTHRDSSQRTCVWVPWGDPREFLQKIKQITRQTGRAWLAHLPEVSECYYRCLCKCVFNKTQEDIWGNPAEEKINPLPLLGSQGGFWVPAFHDLCAPETEPSAIYLKPLAPTPCFLWASVRGSLLLVHKAVDSLSFLVRLVKNRLHHFVHAISYNTQ